MALSSIRSTILLGLSVQHGVLASNACQAEFELAQQACEFAISKNLDACTDAPCQNALGNAANLCTGSDATYWNADEQEMVNATKELGDIQRACNDPCMSKMIGCQERSGTQTEMSCRDECQDWYDNMGACENTLMPESTVTYGQVVATVKLMCEPCAGSFIKFSIHECFEEPCKDGCMELMGAVYDKCDEHAEYTDPTSQTTLNIHTYLMAPRMAMGECLDRPRCRNPIRIPKAYAERWGARMCES